MQISIFMIFQLLNLSLQVEVLQILPILYWVPPWIISHVAFHFQNHFCFCLFTPLNEIWIEFDANLCQKVSVCFPLQQIITSILSIMTKQSFGSCLFLSFLPDQAQIGLVWFLPMWSRSIMTNQALFAFNCFHCFTVQFHSSHILAQFKLERVHTRPVLIQSCPLDVV